MWRPSAIIFGIGLLMAVLALGCQTSEDAPDSHGGDIQPIQPDTSAVMDDSVPGVSDSRVLFSQSAALSGPSEALS